MSHFTVGVITKEKITNDWQLEAEMAPYCEHDEDFFEEFIEFTAENAIAYARQEWEEAANKTDTELFEWTKNWFGYRENEDGDLISVFNSNAKWDWYVVGGRWKDELKHKYTKIYQDSVKIENIDWDGMKADAMASLDWEQWKKHYAESYCDSILATYDGDIEKWKDAYSNFYTYSLLTPDKGWLAAGDMGWFGCSSESADEKQEWENNYHSVVNRYRDEGYYLTIVDCHI